MNKKKDPAAVSLGRKGGLKGGLSRWKDTSQAERSEHGRKMVQARWNKKNKA